MNHKARLLPACLLGLAVAVPAFGQSSSSANSAASNPAAFLHEWDRSDKGLLSLKAVSDAAMVTFELLDKDHKGRLTEQQLAALLTPAEFSEANPDRDRTIGAQEWFDLVRRRFNAANPDHDGSLSLNELKTPAGQALLKLMPPTRNPG